MLQCPDTELHGSTEVGVPELELFCVPRQRRGADQEHFFLPGSSNSREFGKGSYGALGLPADVPLRLLVSLSP